MIVGFLELKALPLLPFKISGLFLRFFKVITFFTRDTEFGADGVTWVLDRCFLSKQFRF